MSTPHSVTPDQWATLENVAGLRARIKALKSEVESLSTASLSFHSEIEARIEALEATQHAHADVSRLSDAEQDRLAQELAKPAALRPLKIETTYGSEPAADAAQILSPRMVVEGTCEYDGKTYRFKVNPERDDQPAPVRSTGSLVERLANLLDPDDPICARGTARAAIREVAKWLRSEYPKREGYGLLQANVLEQEANR